jgi:hypothetical protein
VRSRAMRRGHQGAWNLGEPCVVSQDRAGEQVILSMCGWLIWGEEQGVLELGCAMHARLQDSARQCYMLKMPPQHLGCFIAATTDNAVVAAITDRTRSQGD